MNTIKRISRNLFNIYLLFIRVPRERKIAEEVEFYSNDEGSILGLICKDYTDKDFTGIIFLRGLDKRFQTEEIEDGLPTIGKARQWINEKMLSDLSTIDNSDTEYFDLFKDLDNESKQHHIFKSIKSEITHFLAYEVIKEISYYYKDIDGNFIEQFQTVNGFDARIWELYLFCFFQEQLFSFKRNYNAPDYMLKKANQEIAVEAVIVSEKLNIDIMNIDKEYIDQKLKNEIPLMFGSTLFNKMRFDEKKLPYWEMEHVKSKPLIFAIADFSGPMSMTWSHNAISDYLYGYRNENSFDEDGRLVTKAIKINDYVKQNGQVIPSGFFFQPQSEYVSAIIINPCGTIGKFNRLGRQAGLGSTIPIIKRMGEFHNHEYNSLKHIFREYIVDEKSSETWSEGAIVFHNPNAKYPLDIDLFDEKVSQAYMKDNLIYRSYPEIFPYSSMSQILIPE